MNAKMGTGLNFRNHVTFQPRLPRMEILARPHFSLTLLLFLLAFTLQAADFTGIWVGQIPARNGDLLDIAFKLHQTGNKLEGKLYGDYQSTPIQEAVISGDLVTFIVIAREQAGNQINETRIRFTGKFNNGELELIRDREASTNAGNAGGVERRDAPKQTFRLKRLI
jgi:hypothetical protein